jgi:hypothetical protein
MPDAI